MLFGSISQEPFGQPKFRCYFLSSLDNLLYHAYIIFQESVNNFEVEHKTC